MLRTLESNQSSQGLTVPPMHLARVLRNIVFLSTICFEFLLRPESNRSSACHKGACYRYTKETNILASTLLLSRSSILSNSPFHICSYKTVYSCVHSTSAIQSWNSKQMVVLEDSETSTFSMSLRCSAAELKD